MPKHVHRVRVARLSAKMDVEPGELRHLQVLRLRVGDVLEVFDGEGEEGRAELSELSPVSARLTLLARTEAAAEYPQPVTLAIALLKGDKLSDVVRSATELGAARIQLLHTRYADVPDIGENKLTRLRRVGDEAARQSQRSVVPEVLSPIKLGELELVGQLGVYAHPGSTLKLIELVDWDRPLTLISGPEGGFAPEDLGVLERAGCRGVTLGPRILRAETAPLALLGALAASGV